MRDAFALDLELFDNLSWPFVFGRIVYKQRLSRRLVFRLFFNNLGSFDSIEFLREFINILAKIFNVLFSGIAFRFFSPVDQLLIGLFIGILFGFVFYKLFVFCRLFVFESILCAILIFRDTLCRFHVFRVAFRRSFFFAGIVSLFNKIFAGIIKGVFINLFQLLFSTLFWLLFNNLKLFNDLFFRCGIVSCSLFAR